MKKVFFIAGLALLSVACKKTYACSNEGVTPPYIEMSKDQAKTLKAACEISGGTWNTK